MLYGNDWTLNRRQINYTYTIDSIVIPTQAVWPTSNEKKNKIPGMHFF